MSGVSMESCVVALLREKDGVMVRLMAGDRDEALQAIFLALDPRSLKSARLVCRSVKHIRGAINL